MAGIHNLNEPRQGDIAMQSPDPDLLSAIARYLDVDPGAVTVLASRDGRVVSRVSRPGGDVVAKASHEPGAFDTEAMAMPALARQGVPVSPLIAAEHGPVALLVAAWAEGEPITASTDPAILRQAGAILRRIHERPARLHFSGNRTIEHWIQGWYNVMIDWWETRDDPPPDARARADAWINAIRPALASQPGCYILLDGRSEHFLADDRGNLRLIDVADYQPGEAAMDLAVLELDAPGILPYILDGYAPTPAEQAAFDALVPFHVFLRALSAAEWRSRMLGDHAAARRYLERTVSALASAPTIS